MDQSERIASLTPPTHPLATFLTDVVTYLPSPWEQGRGGGLRTSIKHLNVVGHGKENVAGVSRDGYLSAYWQSPIRR